jgi:hypothetical protein
MIAVETAVVEYLLYCGTACCVAVVAVLMWKDWRTGRVGLRPPS